MKYSFLVVIWLTVATSCVRIPTPEKTPITPKTVAELEGYLSTHKADLDLFRLQGPFDVTTETNHEIRLSPRERFNADVYLSAPAEKAPLVIFLHGYDSSKEAHAYQAMHVASWGMHSLSLQLPNKGSWNVNGRTLGRIVRFISRVPEVIDHRIDTNKIILIGHSFGGSAVAGALAEGVPAIGGILLDPAAIGSDLPKLLQKVSKPVMILGADTEVVSTRNRDYFYRFIRSGVAEVSIRNATHEDGQYPSEFSLRNFGSDPDTTEESQITFVSALTAAAISLSTSGKFDYAWTSFGGVFENGKFFNGRRK